MVWSKLTLTVLYKTHFIQFMNKSTSTSDIFIENNDKQISNTNNTKFIGLFISDTLF
jgi:hypothetical protein